MITKFKIFEKITPEDFQKNTELMMDIQNQENDAAKDQDQTKLSNLKVTDINNRIQFLNKEKEMINQEIIKLQDNQRNLAPNNPNDPQNAQKLKQFTDDQTNKLKIQQQKLNLFDQEIKNLSSEIERNKKLYGV
jgi:uncharacterized small protein (DUF1192 family)